MKYKSLKIYEENLNKPAKNGIGIGLAGK
jgi:hypothetical protein